MAPKRYYAVAAGRNPGIYTTWNEAEKQVNGFSGARHRKFSNKQEAQSWFLEHRRDADHPSDEEHVDNYYPEESTGSRTSVSPSDESAGDSDYISPPVSVSSSGAESPLEPENAELAAQAAESGEVLYLPSPPPDGEPLRARGGGHSARGARESTGGHVGGVSSRKQMMYWKNKSTQSHIHELDSATSAMEALSIQFTIKSR